MQQSNPTIKINEIEPKHTNFQLYFQICEIITKAKGILVCRIVDDTGIIDACFDRYIDKLDKGFAYLMTNLQCGLIDGHPRVQMKSNTVVSKQADIIGFKDKSNDISKKVFQQVKQKQNISNQNQKQKQKDIKNKTVTNKKQQSKAVDQKQSVLTSDSSKKQETLVPFTKQQAKQQLKMMKKIEQIRIQNKKQYQDKSDPAYKQKNVQYKEKHQSKVQNTKNSQFKQKQKQKQKNVKYQQKIDNKNGYKVKQQERRGDQMRNKAKSTLYRQKGQQKNGYKEINHQGYKNNGNKNKFYDDDYGNKKYSKYQDRQRKHSYQQHKYKPHPKQHKQARQATKKQQGKKNNTQNKKFQQYKQGQKKQSRGQVIGNCVNLKARITEKVKVIESSVQKQILIADSTGSVWLRINKLHLEQKQFYEIDNLEVCKDQTRLFLKQSEFSQARRFQGSFSFNLRQINSKQ